MNPPDPDLALIFPEGLDPLLSDKDRAAPTLCEARDQGLLPDLAACLELGAHLDQIEASSR